MRLFDGFAVVALRIRETEQTLLEEIAAQVSRCTAVLQIATYSFSFQKAKVTF